MPTAVIISTWSGASPEHLSNLCRSIDRHPAGRAFALCLAANGQDYRLPPTLQRRFERVFHRDNRGYNLGAWDHAWRLLPDCDRFLFLQDDCWVRRANWLQDFERCFDDTPRCGLVGEHVNRRWDRPWTELEGREGARSDLVVRGAGVSRARYYREALARWSVPEGDTARHVTTVVQFTSRAVLEEVGGYDVEDAYHDAVAAEIAFSRKIESRGYRLVQIGRRRHSRIGHREWEDEGPLGRWLDRLRRRFSL